MSISFTRYVNITSGVAGTAPVRQRQLITRVFSSNPLIPTNSFAEFTSAAAVEAYFGSGSVEAARANFYFSFVSKTAQTPQKISFSSWVQTATAAVLTGGAPGTLAALQTVTAGVLSLTLNETTATLSGLNFSSATSLVNVATLLQTAIRAATPGDTNWTLAIVTFTNGAFVLTGGVVATTVEIPIGVTLTASGTDVSSALGWLASGNAIFSFGSPAMSLTDTMNLSVAASNNFASFCFVPTLDQAQITELATWNAANNNFVFMGLFTVSSEIAAAVSAAIIGLAGNNMTLAPLTTQFPEMIPGIILAATDYTKNNASQSYMYQQFPSVTPSVTTDDDANTYDPLRVNYVGQTQSAGQNIAFYQRGTMCGGATAATDMNVFANELWFKSAVGVALMSMMLAYPEIATTPGGRSTIIATIQSVVSQALTNGTVSPGQVLNVNQIGVITGIVGNSTAYLQIQSIGYFLDVGFTSSVTTDGRVEWAATYTFIYTKNNAIRSVVGTHVLI